MLFPRQGPLSLPSLKRGGIRFLFTIGVALIVGSTSAAAMKWDSHRPTPPGFYRGLLHGALMPLAWPTLLAGHDQQIYADSHSGRTYKLGYSLGVNACGALFFGWFFTRLRRWSRPTPQPPTPTGTPPKDSTDSTD